MITTNTTNFWQGVLAQRERNLQLPLWKRWSLFLLFWSGLTLLGDALLCWTLTHGLV